MSRWRRKAQTIEAVMVRKAVTLDPKNLPKDCTFPFMEETPRWLTDAIKDGIISPLTVGNTPHPWWEVKTPDGPQVARGGDYIVIDIFRGRIHVEKSGEFEASHEEVVRDDRP